MLCVCVERKNGRDDLFHGKIRAIVANKIPKELLSMVTFRIKVRRSYRDFSSQANTREKIELAFIHISVKTDVSR